MRVVFGIMSAVHSAESVAQLARALAPCPVVIHHDFIQTPDFVVDEPNVSFVSAPKQTGWAVWGFSEGIVHLLDTCLNEYQADYFQLLSPTCLPVRPLEDYLAYLEQSRFDAHLGSVQIERDPDLLMNFGCRAYAPKDTVRFKVLQRLKAVYFGDSTVRVDLASLQTRRRVNEESMSLSQRLARLVTDAARRGWLGSHLFLTSDLRATAGGTWFGCNRDAGQYLINRIKDEKLIRFFSAMSIPDEMMFATLFTCSPFDVGDSNHFVNKFDEQNPSWIEASDLPEISASGRYFARKFPDDAQHPVRLQVLESIGSPIAERSPVKQDDAQRQDANVAVS